MKKTLVAVAAMAAVTGALAQATIYGLIDQAYRSDKTTAGTTAATKKTGIDSVLNGGSQFGFKGSEDLGGGLTASFVMELGYETSDAISGGLNNRQSFVGLAGGFGSVNIGRQYSNIFLAACGQDVSSCANIAGNTYVVAADSSGDVRRANAISYNLPSIVPGVTIQVGKSYGEATTTPTSTNAGNGTFYTLGYSAGAIAATLASESRENEGNYPLTNAQGASLTAKRKTTVTGLSYDAGMAKVLYTNTKSVIGAGTTKFSMTGIVVPMGAASIAYQAGTGDTKSIASTTTSKLKGSLVNFNYSLSKRTTAYVKVGSMSETTAAGANTLKISTTAVGIAHGF